MTPPGTVQHGNTTTTTQVTIIVDDIDDNRPVFNEASFHGTLKENSAADIPVTFVTKINVTDADYVSI